MSESPQTLDAVAVSYLMELEQLPLPLCEEDADRHEELHSEDGESEEHDMESILVTIPPNDLEYQCSTTAHRDETYDLEAEAYLCVCVYEPSTDCAGHQNKGGYKGTREELALHIHLFNFSILEVVERACELVNDSHVHICVFIRILISY